MSENANAAPTSQKEFLRALALARLMPGRKSESLLIRTAAQVQMRLVDFAQLAQTLMGLTTFSPGTLHNLRADFGQISFTDAMERNVLPCSLPELGAVFVVPDPWDEDVYQWLTRRIGHEPQLIWGDSSDIQHSVTLAINQLTAKAQTERLSSESDSSDDALPLIGISMSSIEQSQSNVVRLVDSAIYDAWKAGASDIHFESRRDAVVVKFRLDGSLIPFSQMQGAASPHEVVSRIKVLAQLDITERRIPQDGRFRALVGETAVDFRVSIMPSIHGEDAVLRLLDKSSLLSQANVISLATLNFQANEQQVLLALARRPHGMLLVTGPTGSGKTTTLYALVSQTQSGEQKTITIEDPVEYELEGILQIPVNERKGLSFAKGLRSVLRHDPDRILVGEIRDRETAEIAVQAALTGHIVFTTVHANSVLDVIGRFAHMSIDLHSLMSSLNGVVAQRLLRLVCSDCMRESDPSSDKDRRAGMPAAAATPEFEEHITCKSCRGTGYKGRTVVAEILVLDDEIRTMISRRDPIAAIKTYASSLGMVPLLEQALRLVATGQTTMSEVKRVVGVD